MDDVEGRDANGDEEEEDYDDQVGVRVSRCRIVTRTVSGRSRMAGLRTSRTSRWCSWIRTTKASTRARRLTGFSFDLLLFVCTYVSFLDFLLAEFVVLLAVPLNLLQDLDFFWEGGTRIIVEVGVQ